MKITLTLSTFDRAQIAKQISGPVMRQALMAGGRKFWEITRANFGVTGIDRPTPWAPLSRKYIQQLKRKSFGGSLQPTLLRAGTLMNSIRLGNVQSNSIEVWTDCIYAGTHQFGRGAIPARPFFPVTTSTSYGTDAQLTPYADREVTQAMQRAIS